MRCSRRPIEDRRRLLGWQRQPKLLEDGDHVGTGQALAAVDADAVARRGTYLPIAS
jgi:hypothetical protein